MNLSMTVYHYVIQFLIEFYTLNFLKFQLEYFLEIRFEICISKWSIKVLTCHIIYNIILESRSAVMKRGRSLG